MISMKKRVQIEIGKKEQPKNKEKKMMRTSLKMGKTFKINKTLKI